MRQSFRCRTASVLLVLCVLGAHGPSAHAAGRIPQSRGIESGGTSEAQVAGEPDWGSGGRPSRDIRSQQEFGEPHTPGGSGISDVLREWCSLARLILLR